MHKQLEKKYRWYRKWHQFRYNGFFHFLIFAGFYSWLLYLTIRLNQIIIST
jgi:hypothetical protein